MKRNRLKIVAILGVTFGITYPAAAAAETPQSTQRMQGCYVRQIEPDASKAARTGNPITGPAYLLAFRISQPANAALTIENIEIYDPNLLLKGWKPNEIVPGKIFGAFSTVAKSGDGPAVVLVISPNDPKRGFSALVMEVDPSKKKEKGTPIPKHSFQGFCDIYPENDIVKAYNDVTSLAKVRP
jgi:hypothetical protein